MTEAPQGLWRRLIRQLFKPYQLMLLEPQGGKTVKNIRVNRAGLLTIVLVIALASGALVWFYAPRMSEDLSARYYQLQQQNQGLRDQLATGQGELAVAKEQIAGLKEEMQASQETIEELRRSRTVYESILEARKAKGVRILRASARMEVPDPTKGKRQLDYSIVLVKGGNYPRSVTGTVHVEAIGPDKQRIALKLGDKNMDLSYRMDTHTFLEGNVIWKQDWDPVKLDITRMNYKGAERDSMVISVEGVNRAQDADQAEQVTGGTDNPTR